MELRQKFTKTHRQCFGTAVVITAAVLFYAFQQPPSRHQEIGAMDITLVGVSKHTLLIKPSRWPAVQVWVTLRVSQSRAARQEGLSDKEVASDAVDALNTVRAETVDGAALPLVSSYRGVEVPWENRAEDCLEGNVLHHTVPIARHPRTTIVVFRFDDTTEVRQVNVLAPLDSLESGRLQYPVGASVRFDRCPVR